MTCLRHSPRFLRLAPRRPAGLIQHFGSYSVILPDEPFKYGVAHITPRSVPKNIPKPSYAGGPPALQDADGKIQLGGEAERRVRAAATLARDTREFAGTLVKVESEMYISRTWLSSAKAGVTTNEIDAAVHKYCVSHFAYPSPLLYSGFPRSCCTR
jgi:methionyl aminopeptidase